MLTYPLFYRKRGVRLLQQLVRPPMSVLTELFLPTDSIYHFIDHDPDVMGPTVDDPILQLSKAVTVVDHVTEYPKEGTLGKPVVLPLQTASLITKYHQEQKTFKRYVASSGLIKNPRTLVVVNYELIDRHYRYTDTYLTPYFRYANLQRAILQRMSEHAAANDRQQYLQMHLPPVLPPLSVLKRAVEVTNRAVTERINTDTLRFLCDFFHWVGPERDKSLLKELKPEALGKINLIFIQGGLWTTINLGILDGWRVGPDGITKGSGFAKLDPEALQRRVLRMLMSIAESATVAAEKPEGEEADEPPVEEPSGNVLTGGDPVKLTNFDTRLENPTPDEGKNVSATKGPKQSLVSIIRASGATATETDNDDQLEADIPEMTDDDIDKDLDALEKIEEQTADAALNTYQPYVASEVSYEGGVMKTADLMARKGLLSAAEHRRFQRLSTKYKEVPNPFGGKGTLADLTVIKPEELKVEEQTNLIDHIPGVMDPGMLSSSITNFDRRYIDTVFPKDIVSMTMNLQKAGVAITDYKIERTEDYNDAFEVHSLKVVPVVGKPTTIRFQIPILNPDGSMRAGGVTYRMRKQRGDVPIRKTGPDTVTLTSYYSKMFVMRSERAVFNYPDWLQNQIVALGVDPQGLTVTDIALNNVFVQDAKVPRVYSTIAMRVSKFRSDPYEFSFDYKRRDEFFGDHIATAVSLIEGKLKGVPVAKTKTAIVIMDFNNVLWKVEIKKEGVPPERLGYIEEIIGLSLDKRPTEVVEVDIFGKTIPLGFVLAQHVGLGNLLATLKPNYRRAKTGTSYALATDEFMVRFEDEVLIFKRNNPVANMLLAGFNRYHREIKRYSVYMFDKPEVYANVLEENKVGARYIREFDLLFKLWVDHITRDLLIEMNEPTDMFQLFISAVEKLTTDEHPDEMDLAYQRDKGHERIAGMMYFELVKAMRGYVSKPSNANASVDLNPRAVWMGLLSDQTVMPTEESNPIHSLKEKEVVVFSGTGGRTARSMTAKTRMFHRNAMGVVSEATVDNGDVATITYLTADPNYTTLRGTTRRLKGKPEHQLTKMVSTSMLLSPAAIHDDGKRVNFTSVQNSQTTFAEGYTPMPTRTGYERVLAHRTDDMYAKVAEDDGVVDELTDTVLTVRYKDGRVVNHEIGRRFGKWSGHVMPHDIKPGVKKGQKVKKGTVLVFNTHYFTPDTLDPTQVITRSGVLSRVAFMEIMDTLDDSSAIAAHFAEKLTTLDTHVRSLKLSYDQELRNLIKVGERVEPESILCTIHSESSGNAEIFDDAALSTLSTISANTPRAKMTGVVEKIEVLYTGELEDMSASIRNLADRSDSEMRKHMKQMGKKGVVGRVDVGYRVDGHPLDENTAVVRVYITGPVGMGVGDKGVFASQMKTVVGSVLTGVCETEDGEPLDAIFGYYGLQKRIVLSADIMGTANTVLKRVGELAVSAYKGQ